MARWQNPEALCFDLGNTLIQFGPPQIALQYEALRACLERYFGEVDEDALKAVRDRQIVAPYQEGNDFRENNLRECGQELVRELYGQEATEEQLRDLEQVRYDAFMEGVAAREEVLELLARLKTRYRLGLLSNYPCGRSIRDGIAQMRLEPFFDAVVVSGEVGLVKPHRKPFEILLEDLEAQVADAVYVGDNWLADIQGAKGVGMGAILTTEHVPYERFHPKEGDHQPDARVENLLELGELFGV